MIEYEILHYPGNVTGEDDVQPGRVLGANEVDVPWVVMEAEYVQGTDLTTVHLKTGEVDEIRAEFTRLMGEHQANGLRLPAFGSP